VIEDMGMEFIKPQPKTPAAGRDLDAYCTRCKFETAHVIVAMDGQRIVRVQCKSCQSVHAYRGGPPTPRSSSRASGRTKQPLTASEYDRLMIGRDTSRARSYKPAEIYAAEEVINHAKFGLGVVVRVLADRKVEVAFDSGVKVLVHQR
jgi:hypothetical protein